ncbi:UPF0149 family protein [Aliivibrio sp. S2TY2]|uniref:UPF0149 family protein n=1 Tax=unclassified Aliivibrio TaxID=2645654 RepID=UPI0023781A49|nr:MULTISPECIES: UPF0149 family protein [unclassified Aliivibrio]MCP3698702.1 UPF0149 family protein [Aliivibrio sp.]MDD9173467.1 UPF0149 family protein [Aliivibrio sp. S3TY1]MDD9190543.1 UPF0149 family protein [Aliivibrio sp. S2TY2]
MSLSLTAILSNPELENKLLTEAQTQGFIAAMAAAPNLINPNEWLAFLWGGEEISPFTTAEDLEAYANAVVNLWNEYREAFLSGQWQWPEACQLDDEEIVTAQTRQFSEGLLQGWQLTRDDWETLMPEESENNALLGGVLLSISMLFDPETALATLEEQGIEGLDEFKEIYNAVPMMLSGLTMRGFELAEAEASRDE